MPNAAKPGAVWRFLSHRPDSSLELQNDGIFDELVVDDWLHVEQMDERQWWARVGDAQIFVTLLNNGEAEVSIARGVYGPARGKTTVESDNDC